MYLKVEKNPTKQQKQQVISKQNKTRKTQNEAKRKNQK